MTRGRATKVQKASLSGKDGGDVGLYILTSVGGQLPMCFFPKTFIVSRPNRQWERNETLGIAAPTEGEGEGGGKIKQGRES